MDTLRGNFDALDNSHDVASGEDDTGRETPPASIGQDERRMQVRAYNHWASLLEERNFPSIDDLEPTQLPDFGPYSVLLDFTAGIENPGVTYLGEKLAAECDIATSELQTLADVPPRSLLSRITDHYMQILANQAPIGFEAEFVNQRGATILYRGILLPYSTDDEKIDFIYGVINWKELADQHTSDEQLLQVDQALEQKPEPLAPRIDDTPLTDWADGPGATAANDVDDEPLELSAMDVEADFAADDELAEGFAEGLPAFSGRAEDYLDGGEDEEEEEAEDGNEPDLPRPKFGSLMSIGAGRAAPVEDADDLDLSGFGADEAAGLDLAGLAVDEPQDLEDLDLAAYAPENDDYPDTDKPAGAGFAEVAAHKPDLEESETTEFSETTGYAGDTTMPLDGFELDGADEAKGGIALAGLDPADMALGDWLAAAREMAAQARTSEDRTRNALYEAIGRAYDFSLAAAESPQDFDELVVDSGLTVQDRAPMTPVVKLVFGADYDKTRLTEYAAALSHAHRLTLPRGSLGDFLRGAEGGLKGVVAAERRLRREETGKSDPAADSRELLAEKLREMPAIEIGEIPTFGSEFALVMIRRSESGEVAILGEVPEDAALIEKAAKKLVG
jgi:hypothetical protein